MSSPLGDLGDFVVGGLLLGDGPVPIVPVRRKEEQYNGMWWKTRGYSMHVEGVQIICNGVMSMPPNWVVLGLCSDSFACLFP